MHGKAEQSVHLVREQRLGQQAERGTWRALERTDGDEVHHSGESRSCRVGEGIRREQHINRLTKRKQGTPIG